MLASAAAVLTVWLPVGAVIWTRIRSGVMNRVHDHPYFPGGAFIEDGFILGPLLAYLLILPVMHYAWIRFAQPMRGHFAGVWLAVWLIVGMFLFQFENYEHITLLNARIYSILVVTLLAAWGFKLHQRMEIGS